MKKKVKEKLEWLEFELLQPFTEVKHGIFLRGDNFDLSEEASSENKWRALDALGIKCGVKLIQDHKDRLYLLEKKEHPFPTLPLYDGILTQCPLVGLLIRHSDCQAAIFYDREHKAIANVHCGWRGSVCNIYQKTVKAMQKHYGTDPAHLLVCIGPSLGPTVAEFVHYRTELPRSFWKYQKKPNYFDFWEISRMQLMEAGVLAQHIEIANLCTYTNSKECFSYRREGKGKGSHGTIVALLH